MHFLHKKVILPIALFAINGLQADPLLFIKNNSNRVMYIEPFNHKDEYIARPRFVEPKDDYILENVNIKAKDLKGVLIKYCPQNIPCPSIDGGIVAEFEFHDPSATKFYLKFEIDKKDNASLKRQEGRAGRTSDLKWSLKGNIIQDAITRPIKKNPRLELPLTDVSVKKTPQGQSESEFSDEVWAQFPEADALRKKGANFEGNNSEALARAVLGISDPNTNWDWPKLVQQGSELVRTRREEVMKGKTFSESVKNNIKALVKDAYDTLKNPPMPKLSKRLEELGRNISDEAWAQFPEANALRKQGANLEGNNSEALAHAVLGLSDPNTNWDWPKLINKKVELKRIRREEAIKGKTLSDDIKRDIKILVDDAYDALYNIWL